MSIVKKIFITRIAGLICFHLIRSFYKNYLNWYLSFNFDERLSKTINRYLSDKEFIDNTSFEKK
tara:strand:- start:94 stop:285 length:192 start_codon:yes stop_codon:yes gene_type:complete